MYNYMNMALTKTDMVISTAERESMVTATRIVARSVCTPLVATCCAFNTFIDVCKENRRVSENDLRSTSADQKAHTKTKFLYSPSQFFLSGFSL